MNRDVMSSGPLKPSKQDTGVFISTEPALLVLGVMVTHKPLVLVLGVRVSQGQQLRGIVLMVKRWSPKPVL